jgi:hypothetical protein
LHLIEINTSLIGGGGGGGGDSQEFQQCLDVLDEVTSPVPDVTETKQ